MAAQLVDAARRGDAAGVLELLLQYRAIVNQPDGSGVRAMHVACEEGHTEVVAVLLGIHTEGHTEVADVNKLDNRGRTPLFFACRHGHAEIVAMLLAANAEVNQAHNEGATPLYIASKHGHAEIVAMLINAGARVNKANIRHATPLYVACQHGHTEVAAKLIDAGANVHRPPTTPTTPCVCCNSTDFDDMNVCNTCGVIQFVSINTAYNPAPSPAPMIAACLDGHLGCVQLLSSHGASRTFPFGVPGDTAEDVATQDGHHELLAFLVRSRLWSTPLHHLEFITRERTRALLRGGDNIHAAAEPGGPTPLSLARDLEAAARPVIRRAFLHGFAELLAPRIHNALLVLEAAKPWSRKTHHLFPAAARARARELMRVAQLIKRKSKYDASLADVFEACMMPHMVTRDYQPPAAR